MDVEPDTQPRPNLRQFYRVEYPLRDRPTFRTTTWKGAVLDVSESGFRVRVTRWPEPDMPLAAGASVRGAILFTESGPMMVQGHVVRHDGEVMAVQLEGGVVSFATILREQRWLRARHPWWRGVGGDEGDGVR